MVLPMLLAPLLWLVYAIVFRGVFQLPVFSEVMIMLLALMYILPSYGVAKVLDRFRLERNAGYRQELQKQISDLVASLNTNKC